MPSKKFPRDYDNLPPDVDLYLRLKEFQTKYGNIKRFCVFTLHRDHRETNIIYFARGKGMEEFAVEAFPAVCKKVGQEIPIGELIEMGYKTTADDLEVTKPNVNTELASQVRKKIEKFDE